MLQALIVSAAIVLLPSPALAQADTATISGRISDPSGQVLPDTRVTATNTDTGIHVAVDSNADGIYVVRNLRPGRYRLVVEKDGFRTIVLERLTVVVGDALGRNFTMEIGPVNDSVTVIAGREELNLSPAVSTVVSRQFVDNMPLNGRSFQSLIQLTPGAVPIPSGQGTEGQFGVNGMRSNTNYFTVDGVTVNFGTTLSVNLGQNVGGTLPALTLGGGTNSFVSVDAMQEFRTQTSTYPPEFGRSPGSQISIVTSSGTNEFHGTAYDYVRNEAFDARNWFNRPPDPKPALRQQNFGGTIGGPLRRNQTFFFFSYEGLRLRQPQTLTASFYTPETRAAVAPVYRPFVDALPIPMGPLTTPGCDNLSRACLASLTTSSSNPTSHDATSLRVDHAIGRRFTLLGRVVHTPSASRTRSFSNVESASVDTDLAVAGLTAVLGSNVINDLRAGWTRARSDVESAMDDFGGAVPVPDAAFFPPGQSPDRNQVSITFPDGASVFAGTRAMNASRQINVVDTLSVIRGAHQLKFGFDYRRHQPTNQGTNAVGLRVTDFGQLRTGTMGLVVSIASERLTATLGNWSAFAQDVWRASNRLTVTYGLRWEINTPPVSTSPDRPLYAIEGIFDPGPLQIAPPGTPLWRTRYNDLAPRIGAAYELTPSTILRGGGGLFYDLGYGDLLGDVMFGFPYNRSRVISVTGQPLDFQNPAFQPLPISTLDTVTGGNLAAVDPNLRLPQVFQWNASVEQQLGPHQSMTVTYVGSSGRRLLRPDFVVPPSKPAAAPAITATRNAGRSDYAALQVQFQRRLTRGLQALASYAYAHARDTESDDAGGNFFGAAINANYATSLDQVQVPPLAPADFDIRHSFSAAVSYEIPAPKFGGLGQAILKDWAVDTIVRATSAPPFNARIQGISAELGMYRTQPDLVPGQPIWLDAPDQPGGRIVNPDAFTLPAPGVAGNFPRNSIRSPFGINQTDLALRRRFALSGDVSLEFRAEFFNVFNHPMFGQPFEFWGLCSRLPCTGQGNGVFGTVTSTLNESLGGGGLNGGQSAIYAVGGPRSGQFSLKLRF